MNLEGSLDAFGLRDLFHLLASTGKTGALWVRRRPTGAPECRGVVWFRSGQVVGASADAGRLSLARRLVGVGAVDDAALSAAVAEAASGRVGVVRALFVAGAVEPALLQEAAAEQTVDAVYELLHWNEGDFAFDLDAQDLDDVGVGIDAAEVVALADSREEAWADVATHIPSPDLVLSLPVSLAADPVLSRDEWSLVALVDGTRTVSDLVDVTGAGQFRVASVLAGLVSRGLVSVREPQSHDHAGLVQRRLDVLRQAEEASAGRPAPAPPAPTIGDAFTPPRVTPPVHTPVAGPPPAERHDVVPPRPEPFTPSRRPEYAEPMPARAAALAPERPSAPAPVPARATATSDPVGSHGGPAISSAPPSRGGGIGTSLSGSLGGGHQVDGSSAVATAPDALVERDPSVNRSLLLRLIAGVRGL